MALGEEYTQVDSLLKQAVDLFEKRFECKPSYAAAAPGRVNLIGEHTDYSEGFVFPMALPMVTVIVGQAVSTECASCTVVTACTDTDLPREHVFHLPTKDKPLIPGKPLWANYVMGVVQHYKGTARAFNAVIVTSVPLGGGLSSSASLEVATHTFLEALDSQGATNISKKDKALTCQKAEHTFANMPCGIMDQFISVMGKQDNALLIDCRSMEGKLVPMKNPDIAILITNSNVKHELSSSEYPLRRKHCEETAKKLGKKSLRDVTMAELDASKDIIDAVAYRRARHVITENERCEEAVVALENGDFIKMGKLMLQSHESLRDDFEVSCNELDQLVEASMEVPGVYGSRMTGGGFGGCTVTLLKRNAVEKTIQHIKTKYTGKAVMYVCGPSDGARIVALN